MTCSFEIATARKNARLGIKETSSASGIRYLKAAERSQAVLSENIWRDAELITQQREALMQIPISRPAEYMDLLCIINGFIMYNNGI